MTWIKRHPRIGIIAAILAGLVALYALAGFFLVPYLIRSQAPERLQAALGVPAELDEVSFNPFTLRLEARGFRLGPDIKKPMFSLDRLVVDLDGRSLLEWAWVFSELTMQGPFLELVLKPDGSLNLPVPVSGAGQNPAAAKQPGQPEQPVLFLVENLVIADGRLVFQDQTGGRTATVELSPINLDLSNLSTMAEYCSLPDKCGPFSLTATTTQKETLSWKGRVSLVPFASSGRLEVKNLLLGSLWDFVRHRVRLKRPKGVLHLAADYRLAVGKAGLELGFSDMGFKAQAVGLQPAQEAGGEELAFKSLELTGGELDLMQRQGSAKRLSLSGLGGLLALDKEGNTAWANIVPSEPAGAPARPPAPGEAEKPWRFSLGEVSVDGAGLGFEDHSQANGPFRVSLETLSLNLEQPAWPQEKSWPFRLAAVLASGGSMGAQGRLVSLSPELEADYQLEGLNLAPLGPYLAIFSRARLESGVLGTQGKFVWGADGLNLEGGAELSNFSLTEPDGHDELAGLKRLSLPEMKLTSRELIIGQAELLNPRLKLVIDAQGGTNLARAFTPAQAAKPEPAPRAADQGESGFRARLGLLKIHEGSLDFSDLSLDPAFRSLTRDLNGSATGLSTEPGHSMSLEVEGRVDEFGAAKIKGSLRPQALGADTSLQMVFDNLDLKHLSPYAARFAGYRLAAGKLFLDLKYQLKKGRLTGDNRIMAQDLKLGEKVPDSQAPDLPLELAIALLRDSSGRIKVRVPISGDLDDPKVRIGGLLAKAMTGLLTSVVTSPFRLLASLVDTGGDKLDRVEFAPGRAVLPPPQEERLTKLGQALGMRPQLKLVVRGGYSPEADGPALRELFLRKELTRALGMELPPEAERVDLSFNSPALIRAVEEMYVARFGAGRLAKDKEELQARLGKLPDGLPPKEAEAARNRLEQDFTRSLYQQLVRKQDLPNEALDGLGRRRAQAVSRYLVSKRGLPPGRVEAKEPLSTKPGDDGSVPSPLSLEPVR